MAVNVTINTNSDQDERLERVRALLESHGQVYQTVDDMARGALMQKLSEWEQLADSEESKRVLAAYRSGTNAQRRAVREFMNKAPVIVLSGDQSVGVNEEASLLGRVSDDGLPDNTLSYSWSFRSGPSTPSIGGTTTNANLDVTMNAVGTYVFRLTVTDGDKSSFEEISVVVS